MRCNIEVLLIKPVAQVTLNELQGGERVLVLDAAGCKHYTNGAQPQESGNLSCRDGAGVQGA